MRSGESRGKWFNLINSPTTKKLTEELGQERPHRTGRQGFTACLRKAMRIRTPKLEQSWEPTTWVASTWEPESLFEILRSFKLKGIDLSFLDYQSKEHPTRTLACLDNWQPVSLCQGFSYPKNTSPPYTLLTTEIGKNPMDFITIKLIFPKT